MEIQPSTHCTHCWLGHLSTGGNEQIQSLAIDLIAVACAINSGADYTAGTDRAGAQQCDMAVVQMIAAQAYRGLVGK